MTLNAASTVVGGSRAAGKRKTPSSQQENASSKLGGQRSDWRFTTLIERAAFICAHQQGAPNKAASESRYIFIFQNVSLHSGEIGRWKPNFGKNILN